MATYTYSNSLKSASKGRIHRVLPSALHYCQDETTKHVTDTMNCFSIREQYRQR